MSNVRPRRDPSMYGDHHMCHKECGRKARYIARDLHWCKFCLDTEEYPHLAGLTQEERDELKAKNLAAIGRTNIVNSNNLRTGNAGFKVD